LNWNIATPVDLKKWPSIDAYFSRMKSRPAVARAMKEEFALYAEEEKRHKARNQALIAEARITDIRPDKGAAAASPTPPAPTPVA